jgi:hypothetical protein
MKALWLTAAFASSVVGFAWIALAMEVHWQQARGARPLPRRAAQVLRVLGASGLLASLWACLRADHSSMAALVWVLMLTAAAFAVAMALSWRPRWLASLVCWLK